jgi:amino acid adenylation domain-containing protein
LHRIWCNVLKTNALSVHDDFFQSGGHSLLAVQVINRINSQFNIELGINVLFKNPTLRQLAKVIDSEKTPRMTSVIRDIKTLDTSAYIQKDADGTILYPLSRSQRMLWFIQKMDRNNYVFNMPTCLKINGEFDADLFHRATELLVENYDILRTIFVETKDKPFQKILPIKSIRNDGYIVRKLIPADVDMDEYVQRFCRQQSKNPFILDKGPLFKTVIFESAQIRDIHYIFANLHHTISDGWGIKRIVKILETYYQHLMVDKDFIPAKPKLQYCDYCLWQIAKQKTHIPVEQKHYWENKVIKGLPRNQLPTDEPRPRVKTFDGNQIYFNIEKTLYNTLTTFAKTNGISLFAVLLAIVKILIHKHTDDKQITVGVPTEGRNHIELEDQPGLFINTIISTDLITGKETFLECVKTVFNTLTVDLQHKDYPFDLLISKFVKEHDPGHNPVTDILVSQHHAYLKGITFGNSQLEQIDLPIDKSRVDISFVFEENSGHIKCMLEYNSTLYEKSRMTRFIDQFYQLIFDAINCPNKSIQDLEYLSENELTILKRFEYHQKQYDFTLVNAYKYQVKTRPERIAIEENNCFLSFAELNTKVTGIRDWLLSIVKKNEIIGVFLPRSINFVVSMLGILTAGCAVMPIDPSLPDERIKHLIRQSGCKKVITNNQHSALLTKRLPGIPILDINDPGSPGHKMSPFKINPSDKAFILFTSGSTGRPKGIIISHQNMISFLLASQDNIRLEKDDKFLHHTALSFDAAIMEILISLVFGITLVIADDVTKNDPDRLYRFIKAKNITTAFFTPSFIKIMGFEQISTLKKVITGGETAIADDGTMDKHNCSYLNMYGPAETTMAVTHYPICKAQKDTDIPLGKPLSNNEILILDEFLKRKPIGVIGEIYIGGIQVSNGYINNPQETRKRFIPHPFRKGKKVYRTGDLGLWGEDGNLYFRGRRDNQVKIRGIRIELDEIRQLVLQSGEVQDAVITVSKQGVHQEIVCYYIAKTLLEIGSLKRYLGKYISASVIPNRFIQIDQIPLNINGKIDYNALPKPAALPSHANTPNELTSIETKVLALWKETLDTSDIDPDKSFFEMGGNSLLVVTLQNKISNMFDLKIEIADLFQYVSVREMAKRIEDIKNKTNEKSSDSVKPMALRYNKRANQRKKRLQSRRDKNA